MRSLNPAILFPTPPIIPRNHTNSAVMAHRPPHSPPVPPTYGPHLQSSHCPPSPFDHPSTNPPLHRRYNSTICARLATEPCTLYDRMLSDTEKVFQKTTLNLIMPMLSLSPSIETLRCERYKPFPPRIWTDKAHYTRRAQDSLLRPIPDPFVKLQAVQHVSNRYFGPYSFFCKFL